MQHTAGAALRAKGAEYWLVMEHNIGSRDQMASQHCRRWIKMECYLHLNVWKYPQLNLNLFSLQSSRAAGGALNCLYSSLSISSLLSYNIHKMKSRRWHNQGWKLAVYLPCCLPGPRSRALLPYLLWCAAGEPNVTLTRLYSSQQTGARNYV